MAALAEEHFPLPLVKLGVALHFFTLKVYSIYRIYTLLFCLDQDAQGACFPDHEGGSIIPPILLRGHCSKHASRLEGGEQ